MKQHNLYTNKIRFFACLCIIVSTLSNLSNLSAQWNLATSHSSNIDATVSMADGSIRFFKKGEIAVFGEAETLPLSSISDWPANWTSITAAAPWDANTAFLFSGNSYLMLDLTSNSITGGDVWPSLPANWSNQVDAAVDWSSEEFYLFNGTEFLIYNKTSQAYSDVQDLSTWSLPSSWGNQIDAALNGGENDIYLFRNTEFMIYDQSNGSFSESMSINQGGSTASNGSIPSPGERSVSISTSPAVNSPASSAPIRSASATQTPMRVETEEVPYESEIDSEDPGLALRPTTPFPDEYRDDYKAFTSQLMNITWGAATASSIRPLAAKNWLGTGVDILYVDPLKVNKSKRAPKSAILMTDSDVIEGNASEYVIPFGTKFESIGQADTKEGTELLKTFSDFTTTFGGSIGGEVEVPLVASGSASLSYKQMNNTKFGTEKVYGYKQAVNELYKVILDLNWVDNITNQKYRQKLDKSFRTMVGTLKVPSSLPTIELPSKKGDKIPSSLNSVKSGYSALLKGYGTHITQAVTYGGKFISLYEINRSTFESARMNETNFETKASGTIKGVKLGVNAAFDYKNERTDKTETSTFNETSYVTGGGGSTFDTWESKITDRPAPIELGLLPLSALLTKVYFPNDPDIEKKQAILKAVMLEYVCTKMNLPANVDLDNNSFFKELKPLEYTYTVTIDHMICTKIASGEPGSENEVFGNITFSYDGEDKKVWDKDEDNTVSLVKDNPTPMPFREPYTIKLAKGKEGILKVSSHLYEEDTDYGIVGDDDDLGAQSGEFKLHEMTNDPKSIFLDHSYDGDDVSIKITVNRTIKARSY